ncbi:MAG: diacylglycerol kinase family lipid kinase [Sedimentisphaerales bacterium]|nr:diacylglycerol kinase family lipid kinase [Sedimentisphaerales bacterium]
MIDQYQFIVNPKSGSSGEFSVILRLRDYLREQGHRVRVDLTQSLEHAGELALKAAENHCDTIVVAGGDGTVRSVVEAIPGKNIPMVILPCGTENLLAQEFGIDGGLETTIATLQNGVLRSLDLGKINQRYFMAIVGVGFDAEVVRRINQFRRGHITHGDYIWPICRTFWEYRPPHLKVIADGAMVCDEPALVFVGNISRYAVGLDILGDADCSDGRLDLTVYKYRRRRQLLAHAGRTIIKRSHLSPMVIRKKCVSVTIDNHHSGIPVQIDGDPGPNLPLEINIIPSAAKILTPPAPAGEQFCPPMKNYHFRKWFLS